MNFVVGFIYRTSWNVLHSYNNAYVQRLMRLLSMSGINFVANPLVNTHLQGRIDTYPKRRGITRVKELQEAAELYAADELVPAFIVLEEKPLAESGLTIQAVSADKEAKMLAQQNKLIQTISNKVLGKKLDVRYQFTYLTNAVSVNVPFGALEEIAKLDGVKTVFLMPVYEKCETVNTATAGDMIGVPSIWEDLGYTGEGMTIAIEPMINAGTRFVSTDSNGWTVRTKDGKLSAHFEHTIAITDNGPIILTDPD